jgi:hypothetical protein
MDIDLLAGKFRRMGARLKVDVAPATNRVSIDVRSDRKGEFYDVKVGPGVAVDAIDIRPRDRHLLLAVRDEDRLGLPVGAGQRFLCGHDERAWFVAAVPEARAASNVDQAKDALKPPVVREAQARNRVRHAHRHRRKTAAFVRQGEWFFVPAEQWQLPPIPPAAVLRNEPLARTGGKPHRVEELYRTGGELVYVHARTGRVISRHRYERLVSDKARAAAQFVAQRQNMAVLARGRVSHADHKTVLLRGWHFVYMNTENQSQAMRYVAFID